MEMPSACKLGKEKAGVTVRSLFSRAILTVTFVRYASAKIPLAKCSERGRSPATCASFINTYHPKRAGFLSSYIIVNIRSLEEWKCLKIRRKKMDIMIYTSATHYYFVYIFMA